MALPATTFESLQKALCQQQYAPIYLLHGEEGYYIDILTKQFENILPEEEKDFNQYILYAPETDPAKVIDICHKIPMMAQRQVVILKEAQAIRADQLNKLHKYADNPVATTILVICCRGEIAKAKDLLAALKKNGCVVFESKKIADYNAQAEIARCIKEKGLTAEPKAIEMLQEYIGTDLSRLHNEINKLASLLPPNASITPAVVELNVGISREYNTFELIDAIRNRDAKKVFRIISYFKSNPKAVPLVMATASVFNLFADILVAHYTDPASDAELTKNLNIRNQFQLNKLKQAMRNYGPAKTVEIISAIRQYDVKSKGVGSRQEAINLFHDLMFHILTATGRI